MEVRAQNRLKFSGRRTCLLMRASTKRGDQFMKYLKEIAIIFGITMTGEILNTFIPLPIPAGVYGLFILLGLLCTKAVRLSDVAATGNLLLDLMPLMFIPAAVGLIEKFEELKAILIPFLVITVLSTFLVMTITGKAAEAVLNGKEKAGKEREEK